MSRSPVEPNTIRLSADGLDEHIVKKPRLRLQCETRSNTTVAEVGRKRIKLCTIEDGNRDDLIRCTLASATLDLSLVYTCLSYVWGLPDDKETIVLNGADHRVTRNLYAVLKTFRAVGLQSPLWVDALCIDQEDEEDKRVQVAMMGEIYTKAEEVLVWLGPGLRVVAATVAQGDFSDLSVPGSAQHTAESEIEEVLTLLAADTHFHDLHFNAYCKSRRCPAKSGGIAKGTHTWSHILEVMKMWFDVPWFERAWTVQEIVLSQKATLLLGSQRLPWDTASKAWVNLGRHMRTCCTECVYGLPGQDSQDLYLMASRIIDFSTARQKLVKGQHLVEALLRFKWKKSADPRDKLYGLLGLQSTRIPTPVVPNYTLSLQHVFSRFAADTLTTQGWIVPLCLDLTQQLPSLPSWVPDWTTSSDNPAVYAITRFIWSYSYAAAKDFLGCAAVTEDFVLEVDGLRFDTITSIGGPYVLTDSFVDQLHILGTWKELLDLNVKSTSDYTGGGDLEEAFWHTMFAGRFHENERVRPLTINDISRLQTFLNEARQSLREFGDDALIGLNEARSSHVTAVLDRRLFRTTDGWIGVCPKAARVGDELFVLGDCPAPVVLRKVAGGDTSEERYVALGHCYLHGIMYGEAVGMDLPRMRVHIK